MQLKQNAKDNIGANSVLRQLTKEIDFRINIIIMLESVISLAFSSKTIQKLSIINSNLETSISDIFEVGFLEIQGFKICSISNLKQISIFVIIFYFNLTPRYILKIATHRENNC